jgi:NAD+ kinase
MGLRIGLVVHPSRDVQRAVATLRGWAAEHGAELVQLEVNADDPDVAPPGEAAGAGLLVAMGGDGTVLATLRRAAPAGVPVLGVACGSLGALATVAADHLHVAMDRFVAGDWTAHRIPALAIESPAGAPATAINDLVVVRAGASQVTTQVELDGEVYGRFAGDGVIVSTPLGSSAYALAAGGPVVAPGAGSWLVTPLAPHGGCVPPVVVGADARVRLTIDPGYAGARVEVDGRPTELAPDQFDVTLRPDHATLVRVGEEESLIAGLRRRLIIIDSPRVLARDARLAAALSDGAGASGSTPGPAPPAARPGPATP